MTPKEKALEIYEIFYFAPDQDGFHSQNKYRAKLQSKICVSEILKECQSFRVVFWKQVKEEIENI